MRVSRGPSAPSRHGPVHLPAYCNLVHGKGGGATYFPPEGKGPQIKQRTAWLQVGGRAARTTRPHGRTQGRRRGARVGRGKWQATQERQAASGGADDRRRRRCGVKRAVSVLQLSVLELRMLSTYCRWRCRSHTAGLGSTSEWDHQTIRLLRRRQHGRRQLLVGTTAAATAATTATAATAAVCPWVLFELRGSDHDRPVLRVEGSSRPLFARLCCTPVCRHL